MSVPLAPRTLRGRLLGTVAVGVLLALAAMTLGFNLLLRNALDRDATNAARARAETEAQALASSGLTPEALRPRPGSDIWVFVRGRRVTGPEASREVDLEARALTARAPGSVNVDEQLLLYATPLEVGGRRIGTVVAGVSFEPYDHTREVAEVASSALALLLALAVVVATWWALRAALRRVDGMTEAAAEWSRGDSDRRFDVGQPRDELGRLGATLDRMLDRLAASLRRERRLTGEISHELRTPLARITAEADLALRRDRSGEEYREALERIRAGADDMSRTVEVLLESARAGPDATRGTCSARDAAGAVCRGLAPLASAEGVELVLEPGPDAVAGVDREVLERMLHPVAENAVRYGRSQVHVQVGREGGQVSVLVSDDGPGIAAEERERVFAAGVRGEAAGGAPGHRGAGLGLALARRLAEAAGGRVDALPGEGGRVRVRVPAG